jgi:CheY-like chemotaxis protein
LNVLLVDDDPVDLRLFSSALKQVLPSVRIRSATEGQDALDSFRKDGLPDLVITDIKMPGMDGHQFVEIVRGTPRYCCLPILACSTSDDKDDINDAYLEGANAYIVKPSSRAAYIDIAQSVVNFWFGTVRRPSIN